MKMFEVSIRVLDEEYVDSLIVSIARQGYDVYYNKDDGVVCYTSEGSDINEVDK